MVITERWTVIGIFEDQGPAYQAMDDFLQAGFTDISMGMPEEHARHYEHEFSSGRTIVTVKTHDRQQDAVNILH